MAIVVTGSGGHLGEALVRSLRAAHRPVTGIDIKHSPFTDQVGSICDKPFVEACMKHANAVVHTATLHKPHVATHSWQDFIDTNVTGTLVLLEAASAGCPVIATDRFGIPEMIINNETGILLNGGQPLKEQLVSAMKRMISDKAIRKRFAERSREYVEQHFSWHKTGSIICEKLFESFPAWKEQQ